MTSLTPSIGSSRTLRALAKSALRMAMPAKAVIGRLRYLSPMPRRFTGAYASRDEALGSQPAGVMTGYDHDELADVAFARMCEIAPWDYPVMLWLEKLLRPGSVVLDSGGHMGTKFRAFRDILDLDRRCEWIVQDVPRIAAAGRTRALQDGLANLRFVERLEHAGRVDILLASGLLQYLDEPLPQFVRRLRPLPGHAILNKVALRDGPSVVTLERIGPSLVPYQIRDERQFLSQLDQLGYDVLDRWSIPSLSHVIETHPELGASRSAGFALRLRD